MELPEEIAGFHLSTHAQRRMRERRIGPSAVESCVMKGELRPAYRGAWQRVWNGVVVRLDYNTKTIITVGHKRGRRTANRMVAEADNEAH